LSALSEHFQILSARSEHTNAGKRAVKSWEVLSLALIFTMYSTVGLN